jgi:2-(1,2-epoxy-1,2-dihydrophenyl)acetyl-CoA isomerase
MTTVRYEAVDGVATITLDRPAVLNALTPELMTDLRDALRRVVGDESIRVAVLTGAGRGFCSGADLSAVNAATDDEPVDVDGTQNLYNATTQLLGELPVPTIARIQGVAAGGGAGLALACDISIAARSAYFVCTFGPRLGIVPDLGATWHLPRRIGRARTLGLTMLGGRLSAQQAVDWGLIWSAVDDDQLDASVADVAAQLARSSPEAMARIRQTVDDAFANPLDAQLALEMEHQEVLVPRNMPEGAAAFMERREPAFDGRRWTRG